MSKRLYLDHAATAPISAVARAAYLDGLAIWANPSSPHSAGRAARAALETARARVAAALGWRGEVIFTSGASEAITLGLGGARQPCTAISAVEHDAVLRTVPTAERLSVDTCGLIRVDDVRPGALVAVQSANSETGVLQPLQAIREAVRGRGGLLFVDAAQTAGKLPLPDADMIALAGHKFGAPPGVGALLVNSFAMLRPLGGQERGYRGGTENLPGVMAMAAALEAPRDWLGGACELRAWLDAAIQAEGGEIVARDSPRIATVAAYRMPGVPAAVQLIRFDLAGIAVSAGSACASGSMKPSHVLTAMHYATPHEVIRVSIGAETTRANLECFMSVWRSISLTARAKAA